MRWRGPSMVRLAPTLDPKTLALKCFKPRTSRRASQARHDLRGCPAPRLEVGERPAHALLEWSIGCGLAQRGRAPCFVGAEAEQAQRPDHLLGGGPCLGLAPPDFRLPPRHLAGGQRVAEQLLGVAQLVLRAPSDRDLAEEAF